MWQGFSIAYLVPDTKVYIFTPRQYEFVVSYYTRMLHEYRYDTLLCQNSIVPVGMNRYPEVGVQGYLLCSYTASST